MPNRNKPSYKVDLVANQADCSANYARLQSLLPDMRAGDDQEVGLASGARMRFTIKERAPFTTTLVISLLNDSTPGNPWSVAPQFTVQVYHDARMAEVVAFAQHRRLRPSYHYPNSAMYQRDEKAQLNRYLGEWLSHCLRCGHSLHNPTTSMARC